MLTTFFLTVTAAITGKQVLIPVHLNLSEVLFLIAQCSPRDETGFGDTTEAAAAAEGLEGASSDSEGFLILLVSRSRKSSSSPPPRFKTEAKMEGVEEKAKYLF